ncbi:PEP-CTERM sorting domain-containing protein [Funiculus sociatus GB2-A5]|uniref:PEP-CTERM sorting domain-containing protein n=2 Tax=Cyanobacteriota TaxID=1117 RepID=A0ABV0JRG3_9CYAN|nr:PEP-CTERM sorting domain-containing protein [Trichocoleus sp. FACHB-6]
MKTTSILKQNLMKLKQASTIVGLLASSALALSVAPAQAFNFNSGADLGTCAAVPLENLGNNTASAGPTSCTTADGITLTAGATNPVSGGAKLTKKEVNGVKGVGVYNDSSKANLGSQQETDFGETLTLSVEKPTIFESLDLSFLYQKGEFGDFLNEVAQVTAGGFTGTLKVLSATQAQWNWNGIEQLVTALSPSNKSGGGLYSIVNPFGNTAVSSIVLTSPQEAGRSYRYSDFALAGAKTASASVPEPTTLAGLGLVGGLLVASRRRKRSQAS